MARNSNGVHTLILVILDFSSPRPPRTFRLPPARQHRPAKERIVRSSHVTDQRLSSAGDIALLPSVSSYTAGTLLAFPAVSVTGAIALTIDKWLGAVVDSLQPRSLCENSQAAK